MTFAPSSRRRRSPAAADPQIALFNFGMGGQLEATVLPEAPAEPILLEPEGPLSLFTATGTGPVLINPALLVPTAAPPTRHDYRITEDDRLGLGSPEAKAEANLRVIDLLGVLLAEGRHATPEEQRVLVQYAGWGALAGAFEDDHPRWGAVGRRLRALLPRDRWQAARASTPTAFWTPEAIVRGMWSLLMRMGLTGGVVLEPAAGPGPFIGLAPAQIAGNLAWTAVEPDPITADVLANLYPSVDLRVAPMETALVRDGVYDVALGNVPFDNYSPYDSTYNPASFRLHDYIILRSLAALRPGGVAALISSRGTLDKQDPAARTEMARHAELLGAVRFPEGAFATSGTDAVTDLLVLRRRATPLDERDLEFARVAEDGDARWIDTAPVDTADGVAWVNRWFADHPDMILGTLGLTSTRYDSQTPTVRRHADESVAAGLARVAEMFPTDVFTAATGPTARPTAPRVPAAIREGRALEGSFWLDNGVLVRREGLQFVHNGIRGKGHVSRISELVTIRDRLRAVMNAPQTGATAEERDRLRASAFRAWERFCTRWGPINKEVKRTSHGRERIERPNLKFFRDDPEAWNVAAIEIYDPETHTARPAPILERDITRPATVVDHVERADDALLLCLDRHGRVDLQTICELWGGRPEQDAIEALQGRIFLEPTRLRWETADHYLSGDVRRKLADAQRAAGEDPRFIQNAEALAGVQPTDLTPRDIEAGLGSSWIPDADLVAFARHLLAGYMKNAAVKIGRIGKDATCVVNVPTAMRQSAVCSERWGTPSADLFRLLDDSLNQRRVRITKEVEQFDPESKKTVTRRVTDVKETLDAREKQEAIEEEFRAWVWKDTERAPRLARLYNERFNGRRPRAFDGRHLTLPGASDAILLDDHQKDVVWRIISDGNCGMNHEVGWGKTFSSVAAGMELKRLGLAHKVAYVCPNHMLEQYSREFLTLYPNARILAAGTADLKGDGRKRFLARAATSDFDAIIMTHAAFGQVPMSPDFRRRFVTRQLAEYDALIAEAKLAGSERDFTVKSLESARRALEAKLQRTSAKAARTAGLSFEQTGIDCIFLDEAHLFKNLATPTKIEGIPVASKPSNRATDLAMKLEYIDTIRPGRGAVLMTGTPVSNTLAELYVMLKYLAPRVLEAAGCSHFDAWAGTFTRQCVSIELAPDGSSYRARTRFRFTNLPELIAMFRSVADIRNSGSLYEEPPEDAPAAVRDRPRVFNGRIEEVVVKPSPEQEDFRSDLVLRAEMIYAGKVDPWDDNMLLVTTDGRKSALDHRLINPRTPEWSDTKLGAVARRVTEIHRESEPSRGTQLVFCDLSNPEPKAGQFSFYLALRAELVRRGIPDHEIAFIHDARTDTGRAQLFRAIREGRVRVLIASTAKAGVGTNIQTRLVAIHHVDAPWRPADIEQRDGRGIRRGNSNPYVRIIRYVGEGSFDGFMYQCLEYKATEIQKAMSGELAERHLDDIGEVVLSFSQMKALASGDPRILEKAQVDSDVARLSRAELAHEQRLFRLTEERATLPARIAKARRVAERAALDIPDRKETRGEAFAIELDGNTFANRREAAAQLRMLVEAGMEGKNFRLTPVGTFAGFRLLVGAGAGLFPELVLQGHGEYSVRISTTATSPEGNLQVLENMPERMDRWHEEALAEADQLAVQLAEIETLLGQPFEHAGKLATLRARKLALDRDLGASEQETRSLAVYVSDHIVDDVDPDQEGAEDEAAEDGCDDDDSAPDGVEERLAA